MPTGVPTRSDMLMQPSRKCDAHSELLPLLVLVVIGVLSGCAAHDRLGTQSGGGTPGPGPVSTVASGAADTASTRRPDQTTGQLRPEGEPTWRDAVQAMTMRTDDSFLDCDENGIRDSIDILSGRTADRNGNWVDDYCDYDPFIRRQARSNSWRSVASQRDTVYFEARHVARRKIRIRYTVPLDGGHVTVSIMDWNGIPTRQLVDRMHTSGAYQLIWDKTDSVGRTVRDVTEYQITLKFKHRSYTATAEWQNGKRH